ncbi:ABC transporter substrate-binding protein [Halorubrum vacuolatum]|uniref:Peptide/nickel transport system substrate-binding protein n=1 Tax=Halorubrum vacuolatum TaxID=63740 RepID=A0A238VAG0_HALVU|nr:ABC transporter substrate-binding protein [Halorubrum vacuolatum]SNR31400.1 peptide/nickel transport system substrate-binding protein [Halorubrum vacuolatum]
MPPDSAEFAHTGISRRQWLSAMGVAGVTAAAGCADEGDPTDDDDAVPAGDQGAQLDLSRDPPPVEGTYHAVQGSSFDTINPLYNTESGAGTAIGYALDQGYTFDGENEVFPLLLETIEDVAGDGSEWRIQFRENLEFSDPYGAYTADDYVYLIQEVHQSDWANTANATDWQGVEVEATGELEVHARLADPNIIWPETFDPLEYPIPKDLLEPYVAEEDAAGLREHEELLDLSFAGNLGPYTLEEWIRDGGTRYVRNDEYYLREVGERNDDRSLFGNAPYFEDATIQILDEEAQRVQALAQGETDNVTLPPDRAQEFIEDEEIMVILEPTPFNTILSVNMRDNGWTHGPGNLFTVTAFRQAIAAAINKEEFIEGILRGFAEPHFTWQPEFSEWFPEDLELTRWGDPNDGVYGPEAARQLAEEALDQIDEDYSYDGDVLVGPEGNQVELTVLYNAASETQELAADFIAREFENNLGIELDAEPIDGTTFSENYWQAEPEPGSSTEIDGEEVVWEEPAPQNPGPRSVTSDNEWDLATIFGLNTYPRNPITNQVFFDGPNSQYNPVGYYPEFDAAGALQGMRNAETRDELTEAAEELFAGLNEEQPYIMLAFGDDIEGYQPDIRGPFENFSSGFDFAGWHRDDR